MGQSVSLATEIEIDAPPATVRSVFMDFSRYPEWCKWKITIRDADKKPSELKLDDKLNCDLEGMNFSPRMIENSEDKFIWEGALWPIFIGRHLFYFSPSTKTPGGTRMIQSEEFTGLLSFLMNPGWSFREGSLAKWNTFFVDLKAESEKVSRS